MTNLIDKLERADGPDRRNVTVYSVAEAIRHHEQQKRSRAYFAALRARSQGGE